VQLPDPIARIAAALDLRGSVSTDFDLNPDVHLPEGRALRPASVLIPLQMVNGRAELILTKRSARLKHHPGQIAFPGGKQDDGDGSAVAAALREAQEEIGLPPELVQVLGELPAHETVTGYVMTPILGFVRDAFDEVPEAGEVDEVFRVPLNHLTTPANFRVEARRWQGRRRYYYAVPYGPYYIWGATARILRALAERVAR
jgi:8-oxo-dGTP pyrophosphatase MutT (NUDIX family)